MMTFLQDIRYALRSMRKNPAFVIVAAITLALGIGFNTGLFTLFNALALRPLPVKDPASVVNLSWKDRQGHIAPRFSYPDYIDVRDRNHSFEGALAYTPMEMVAGAGRDGRPEKAFTYLASANYFPVLGATFALGRPFAPEEDSKAGAGPVAVLSYGYWQSHFAGDRQVLGRTLRLNGARFAIVGVASPEFAGPEPVTPDLWIPLSNAPIAMPGMNLMNERGGTWLQVLGRLKPGVSLASAQADLAIISRQLDDEYRKDVSAERRASIYVTPGSFVPPQARPVVMPMAMLVFGAVSLVLLIACANVANLLLARATARQKEIGIRTAIGATRFRIVRQLLTESLVIAALGSALGLLFSGELVRFGLSAVAPMVARPLALELSPDVRVLAFSLFVMLGTTLAFGLAPALQASRPDCVGALKDEGVAIGRRMTRSRLRSFLVVAQVSVSLLLLVAAGLLLRALGRAQTTDPGFEAHRVLVSNLDLRASGYDVAGAERFQREVAERLRGLPGIGSVAFAQMVPLASMRRMDQVTSSESPNADASQRPLVTVNPVSAGFFDTLRLPMAAGRAFTVQEEHANVAVINQAAARRLFPGKDPVGQRVRMGFNNTWYEVVGVMKDARLTELWSADEPYICYPISGLDRVSFAMLVRTEGDPRALVQPLIAELRAMDREVPANAQPMDDFLAYWILPSRIGAALAGALGLLALVLASTGVYGLMSHAVSQRTREIGIRMALGAPRSQVTRLVLGHGMRLVAIGAGVGIALSLAAARLLSSFLYGLSSADPITFGGVTTFLAAVAALACYLPARHASRVDPIVALRNE